ncbi:hypothetical protein AYI83_15830 [Shewanella algae]|uniref:hypothetical protein n=1 Tax=Shewanella algae TaxID=38313 RepID=UPI00118444B4|nr:hypothetical protein [Shewanella algae]TVK95019.1 hypothetical protein AYI83_15830 [Shewanella algae]
MSWLSSLFGFLTNPIADLTGGYRERKRIAAETAGAIASAEAKLKIAQFTAQAARAERQDVSDTDYDLAVMQNRRFTLMDELIIIVFLGMFISHFVPNLQPYMHGGWVAMGYQGAPWWFEFVIVGIVVSTLGLMRLFRAFWGREREKKQ